MRTPFKLRSASPFKNERMVHTEGGKNLLKDVTVNKGKKSIYTYKKMHADLLAKGMSQADADKQVQKAKGFNQEKYGTQNPTKEGKTENYREEKGSMEMKDVASPGTEGKEGQDGAMMDSFSPQETRMLIRERKINKNRKDKYENKNRRQTGRYDKALKRAIKGGMTKEEFDLTKKGKRMNMRTAQSQENIDDYTTGYKRSQMANQQGVNQADGTQVQYDPDNVGLQKRTASTEGTAGSDTTEASADDIANLRNTDSIDLGKDTSDSSYTESLSGGSGGSNESTTNTDTDSSTETTETDNGFLKTQGNKLLGNIKAMALGGMPGVMLNNIDADGDGDTAFNDTNNDGTMLSRFISKISGGDNPPTGATKYGNRGGAPFKMKKYK